MGRQALTPGGTATQVAGEGRDVVFVPGLASGASTWTPVVERLGAGLRTHVLTLPGFDAVAPLAEPGLDALCVRVRKYVAALSDAIVVGHSLGGFVALALACDRGLSLRGVVVVDGLPAVGAGAGLTAPAARRTGEAYAAGLLALPPAQREHELRTQFAAMVGDPAAAELLGDAAVRSDPATVGRVMADLMAADLRPRLRDIACPVRAVLAPAMIPALADSQRAQLDLVPGIVVTHVPNVRHFVTWDAPGPVVAAIEALR